MNQRLFYLLNLAHQRIYKYADQNTDSHLGISITQLGALLLIREDEGCLLKDIANTLNLNNSALTGLASRMEKNGLLLRKPCEHDGRASRMYLTPLGHEKVQLALPLIKQLNSAIAADFSDDEIKVIVRFLNHLLTVF
ncbi:MarR family winged helix-turn-helix transcriptional regulator [Pseudomonas sp. HK3]